MNMIERTRWAMKQFWTPTVGSGWALDAHLSGERSYARDVGDGSQSSLVEACVSWIANAFTQTMPVVMRYKGADHFGEPDRRHPAARLIRRPTLDPRTGQEAYSWIDLISASVTSFCVDGNNYWRKRRSAIRRPVQVWYLPHWSMEPIHQSGSGAFVDFYRYRMGGITEEVDPQDIVHFRDGIDPENPLKGMSKLKKLLREIYTDEEAARWTASLLRNNGVPGVVISPGTGAASPSEDEAKLIKARFMADFSGDKRGEPIVLGAPTNVQQYGFNPDQMKLGELRDIPEERVSAVLGVPAAVAGLGAGLQAAQTNATFSQLVDLGWMNGVLPRTRNFAATITGQLLSDFEESDDIEFEFNTSRVPIMADYQAKIAEKNERLFRSAISMRSDAKRSVGLPATKDDDVYAVQAGVTFILPDGKPQIEPKPLAATAPPALPAGNTPPPPAPAAKSLTDRQADIAELLDAGTVQKKIAMDLGISERTVEREVSAIKQWRKMAEAVV